MATPSPSSLRAAGGNDCHLLSATARFLIWATRNHPRTDPPRVARTQAPCS